MLPWLERFVEAGHLADVALAVLFLEIALVQQWRRRSTRFRDRPALLANLLAGACLLVALRAALAGWPSALVVAGVSGALIAHVVDLRARLREASALAGPRDEATR